MATKNVTKKATSRRKVSKNIESGLMFKEMLFLGLVLVD